MEGVERPGVATHHPGVREDGVDVQRRVVVGVEGAAKVGRRARRPEQIRRAENRVAWIVDVAAEAVRAPRRRKELHRALRAGGAARAHLAEGGLDEVDGGEHVPRHAEPALGLTVVGEQTIGGQGRTGAEGRERQPGRWREPDERAPGGDDVARVGSEAGGKPAHHRVSEGRRREAERQVEPLLVERPETKLA